MNKFLPKYLQKYDKILVVMKNSSSFNNKYTHRVLKDYPIKILYLPPRHREMYPTHQLVLFLKLKYKLLKAFDNFEELMVQVCQDLMNFSEDEIMFYYYKALIEMINPDHL